MAAGPSRPEFDAVREAADFLQSRLSARPEVVVVLGSGLGGFAETLEAGASVGYNEIPRWPSSALVGHAGVLRDGTVGGRQVATLSGRAHLYQGFDRQTIALPIRVMATLGASVAILTNASGAINTQFEPGSVMVIDDHINAMGDNPLIGPHDDRFGVRFPDMTEVYSQRLRSLADSVGATVGLSLVLVHGVYVAVHGPSFETPAEIRYLRTIGADAVGMSTVPEAIVARQMGLEVLGLSCIANMAAGVRGEPLYHLDVVRAGERLAEPFGALLTGIIERL